MTPVCRLPCVPRKWWRGKDSNLRRRKPADLQSAPVGRLGTPPRKNEPRILVATPRSVNGIGATFATVFAGLIQVAPRIGGPLFYMGRTQPRWGPFIRTADPRIRVSPAGRPASLGCLRPAGTRQRQRSGLAK